MENNSPLNNLNNEASEFNEESESYEDFNKRVQNVPSNANIPNLEETLEGYQPQNIENKLEKEDYSHINKEIEQNERNINPSRNSLSNQSPNYYSHNYEEKEVPIKQQKRTKSRARSLKTNHTNEDDLNSSRESYVNNKKQISVNLSQDYQDSFPTSARQSSLKPNNSVKSEDDGSTINSYSNSENYPNNRVYQKNQKFQNDNILRKKSLNTNVRKNSRVTDRQKSLPIEIGKSIRLLCNGDPFYRGHKFLISTRRYRYFDVFIDDISNTLKANFGAIRKIYTVDGNRLDNLNDFEDGLTYVAAGNEKFIRLNYIEISEGKRQRPHRLPSLSKEYAYHITQYEGNQSLVIKVFRNGDVLTSPTKILLYKNSMVSFEAILNEISSKIKLKNGPVLKLYKMNGELVFMPAQLENGFSYVAASRERFKNFNYEMMNENSKTLISKSNAKDLPPVKMSIKNSQIKSNPKTRVDFNKSTNKDIFNLHNPANESTSNNGHDREVYGNMNREEFNSNDEILQN